MDVLFEVQLLLLFRFLKVLLALSVRDCLVVVFVLLDSQLLVVETFQVVLLLLGLEIDLLFFHRQLSCRLFEVGLLLFDLFFELSDLLVVLGHGLLQLHVTCALLKLNISVQSLDPLLDGVEGNFFDKDLFTVDNRWLLLSSGLRTRIPVFNTEARQGTVVAH